MSYFFFFLALVVAILDWIAVAKKWKRIEYFAKPATMLALLAWLGVNSGFQGPMLWFALGLLFSLGGDVFLMLPKEQFIPGLVSFLIGHICYLIGFNYTGMVLNAASLILLVVVLFTGYQVYRRVATGLQAGGNSKLKLPVLIYSIIISLMLFSALTTLIRSDWRIFAAVFASTGALLFFISDTTLALNKFVAPIPNGRVIVMVTYHLGQILIALGAALRFLN
jgi:alkenylglycerophosphocholine hydrolase